MRYFANKKNDNVWICILAGSPRVTAGSLRSRAGEGFNQLIALKRLTQVFVGPLAANGNLTFNPFSTCNSNTLSLAGLPGLFDPPVSLEPFLNLSSAPNLLKTQVIRLSLPLPACLLSSYSTSSSLLPPDRTTSYHSLLEPGNQNNILGTSHL